MSQGGTDRAVRSMLVVRTSDKAQDAIACWKMGIDPNPEGESFCIAAWVLSGCESEAIARAYRHFSNADTQESVTGALAEFIAADKQNALVNGVKTSDFSYLFAKPVMEDLSAIKVDAELRWSCHKFYQSVPDGLKDRIKSLLAQTVPLKPTFLAEDYPDCRCNYFHNGSCRLFATDDMVMWNQEQASIVFDVTPDAVIVRSPSAAHLPSSLNYFLASLGHSKHEACDLTRGVCESCGDAVGPRNPKMDVRKVVKDEGWEAWKQTGHPESICCTEFLRQRKYITAGESLDGELAQRKWNLNISSPPAPYNMPTHTLATGIAFIKKTHPTLCDDTVGQCSRCCRAVGPQNPRFELTTFLNKTGLLEKWKSDSDTTTMCAAEVTQGLIKITDEHGDLTTFMSEGGGNMINDSILKILSTAHEFADAREPPLVPVSLQDDKSYGPLDVYRYISDLTFDDAFGNHYECKDGEPRWPGLPDISIKVVAKFNEEWQYIVRDSRRCRAAAKGKGRSKKGKKKQEA